MTQIDDEFASERAAAFEAHCRNHHTADFEVCPDPRCRAVVIEEARRGLLNPGDVWPPIDPDDKPIAEPIDSPGALVYILCVLDGDVSACKPVAVLSDFGAALKWRDEDIEHRALRFVTMNQLPLWSREAAPR